jgi:transcriptional regulator with XRE-family HTH domain
MAQMKKRSIDPKLVKLTHLAITELDRTLETAKGKQDLYDHVGIQLRALDLIAHKLAVPIVEKYSFDELYDARKLQVDYLTWLFLHFPEPLELLDDFLAEKIDIKIGLRAVRIFMHTYHAMRCSSAEDWWFETFERIMLFFIGVGAENRLLSGVLKQPKDEREILKFGKIKSGLLMGEFLDLDGQSTPEIDERVIKLFKTRKHNYPLNLPLNPYRLPSDYDKIANYMEQILSAIRKLNPKNALQMLYDGSLRNFIAKRATDRSKDYIRPGRGFKPYKEIGQTIKRLRVEQGLTQKELASKIGYPIEDIEQIEDGKHWKLYTSTISKIATQLNADIDTIIGGAKIIYTDFQEHDDDSLLKTLQLTYKDSFDSPDYLSPEDQAIHQNPRELALRLFPEGSDERKILEYCLYGNPDKLANELDITPRWLREKRKKVREAIIKELPPLKS